MSKIIIGIHGLGNKPPEKLLKKWWKASICEGLNAIGQPRLFIRFKLVYWAHYLHPQPLNPKERNENSPYYLDEPYVPAATFTKKKPGRIMKRVLDYVDKQLDKIFLNDDLSINFSSIADSFIHHFFIDLDAYYSSACIQRGKEVQLARDKIREKLTHILKKHRRKDILLIAHSMGSIVAYDVLSQCDAKIGVDTLITIGSPLGIPVIIGKIAGERKSDHHTQSGVNVPETIRRAWYNFSDIEDKVALDHSLGDDYAPNSRNIRVIDQLISNTYEVNHHKNPHKSYGYLRAPEIARVIHNFLMFDRSRFRNWLSATVNRIFSRKTIHPKGIESHGF
ncbi:alpha/beta hydrolase [candidate division KSB1 bacterium]|nr:alpha/beta hydrolase [candidate division KSB1 bacterium]